MILNHDIITDININSLTDLNKLKHLEEESNLKINRSEIARELSVDRRTVDKYINGFEKSLTKEKQASLISITQL